jgi:hypothetical protein
LALFTEAYFSQYQAALADRKVDINIAYCINNEEELLLFTFFRPKGGWPTTVGVRGGMNAANAQRTRQSGELGRVLAGLGHSRSLRVPPRLRKARHGETEHPKDRARKPELQDMDQTFGETDYLFLETGENA